MPAAQGDGQAEQPSWEGFPEEDSALGMFGTATTNRTLKDEVFIPNPSSVLISSNLKVILQQRTTGLSPLPLPRNTPDWLQVAVRTSFFAGEHLCKNRASFLFCCALWKWLQDLTAWTGKFVPAQTHLVCTSSAAFNCFDIVSWLRSHKTTQSHVISQ